MAEGIIYDMFSEEKHVVDSDEVAASWQQDHGGSFWVGDSYVSCDYGTQNRRHSCCGAKGRTDAGTAGGSIIIPEEIRGSRKRIRSFRKI